MEDQKLVLDVSGKDRAAISVMHAYMRARGLDPDDLLPEDHDYDAFQQDMSLRQRWIEKAQELADNPDPECSTGCLATESMLRVIAEDSYFHPDHRKSHAGHDVVAIVVKKQEPHDG